MEAKPWYHNALVWAVILLVVFLVSFYASTKIWKPAKFPTVQYGDFEFVKAGGLWNTEWTKGDNLYHIRLRFNPFQVSNVSVTGFFDRSFNRNEVYLTFDPRRGNFTTLSLAMGELSLNMLNALGAKPIAACTVNQTTACENRPMVNCGDVNRSVIFLSDVDDAQIAARGECLILTGSDLDILRSVDRLLYIWYGMMELPALPASLK